MGAIIFLIFIIAIIVTIKSGEENVMLIFFVLLLLIPIILIGLSLGILFIAAGSVVGLPVGIFYGMKNYLLSIQENIKNKTFKILMIVITGIIIIMILFYSIGITYFLYGYFK